MQYIAEILQKLGLTVLPNGESELVVIVPGKDLGFTIREFDSHLEIECEISCKIISSNRNEWKEFCCVHAMVRSWDVVAGENFARVRIYSEVGCTVDWLQLRLQLQEFISQTNVFAKKITHRQPFALICWPALGFS